jgi:biopolymer transport protein ExbD/biopolymer transport protein TolR
LRRRRSGRLHLNAEINVVSLIDVMMLLLVIFMITAPLMQGGVDVKLPEASAKPLEDKGSLVVTVDRRGRIFVDKDGCPTGIPQLVQGAASARRSAGVASGR